MAWECNGRTEWMRPDDTRMTTDRYRPSSNSCRRSAPRAPPAVGGHTLRREHVRNRHADMQSTCRGRGLGSVNAFRVSPSYSGMIAHEAQRDCGRDGFSSQAPRVVYMWLAG